MKNLTDYIKEINGCESSKEKVQEIKEVIEEIMDVNRYIETQTSGCYFVNKHKIFVNNENDNILSKFIILMHESVHGMLGETALGFYMGDISLLINVLLELLELRKVEYMIDYCARIGLDASETLKYVGDNVLEIDVVLSQYDDYVECAKFCSKLYLILQILHSNSMVLNEGCATYISNNYSENVFNSLFNGFSIDKMPKCYKKLLREYQEREKYVLKYVNSQTCYGKGYEIAEKIYNKYGEDGLLFSAIAAANVPYYEYDLFSMDLQDLHLVLNGFYNCDKRWERFLEISKDLVIKAIKSPNEHLPNICEKLQGEEYPKQIYKNNISSQMCTEEVALKFGFLNNAVLEFFNRINNKEVNILNAFMQIYNNVST